MIKLEQIKRKTKLINTIRKASRKEKCKKDFKLFCQEYLPHLFSIKIADFHHEIMNILMDEKTEKRIVIIAPRKHGKTTIIISFMLWLLCYKYSTYLLFVGANGEMAIDRIEKVLDEIETNLEIRRDFRHLRPMIDRQGKLRKYNKKGRIFQSRQVIQARGYNAGMRGELILGMRPDCIFIDDAEKEDVINSPTLREKLRRIFMQSVEHLGSAFEETNIIVTDTMKHFDSLASNLEKRDDWECYTYSAIKRDSDEIIWEDVYCYHVEDLKDWEIKHWDLKGSKRKDIRYREINGEIKDLQSIRTPFYGYMKRENKRPIIGLAEGDSEKSEIFEQEYLSLPIRLSSMPLRKDNWEIYSINRRFLNDLEDKIFMLDLSMGNKDSDYQAGVVTGRLGRKYYVINAFLERIPIVLRRESGGEIIKDANRLTLSNIIASFCKRYNITEIYVEDNGMQAIYQQILLEDIETLYNQDEVWLYYCRKSNMNPVLLIPSIMGWTSKGDKHERIKLHLGILMQKGHIYFRSDWADKYRTFANHINEYPQLRYFDAPDVLDMSIRVLEERLN